LFAITNEFTTSILTLTPEEGAQLIFENTTLRLNQSFIVTELEEDKGYVATLTVYDSNSNLAKSQDVVIMTNVIPKIPWDLYFGALVVGIIAITGSYFIFSFILKLRYNRLAEAALSIGDYAKSIKLFYKGKNQEKIVEIVKVIMNNPELASKMNEIAQAAELEDYISEIHDLIAHEA
ncbi:MAG: hypothetical protein ACW99A_23275, partial [Candidatus Kariarchaeaceae archaeon]